jgi:hypothetical protein
LRARLRLQNYSKDETKHVISEIAKKSMYWREAEGIASLIHSRHLGLESVRLYNEAMQRLGSGGIQNMRASAQPIRQIARLASSIHDAHERLFGIDSATFRWRRDAAIQLAQRLESPHPFYDSVTAPDATRWLREYCESQLRSYGAHCAN